MAFSLAFLMPVALYTHTVIPAENTPAIINAKVSMPTPGHHCNCPFPQKYRCMVDWIFYPPRVACLLLGSFQLVTCRPQASSPLLLSKLTTCCVQYRLALCCAVLCCTVQVILSLGLLVGCLCKCPTGSAFRAACGDHNCLHLPRVFTPCVSSAW
jgi:hypothetical protein